MTILNKLNNLNEKIFGWRWGEATAWIGKKQFKGVAADLIGLFMVTVLLIPIMIAKMWCLAKNKKKFELGSFGVTFK